MKTARFLLACAAASVLAACGNDAITAPASPAAPLHPRLDSGSQMGSGNIVDPNLPNATSVCVTILNQDGTVSTHCESSVTSGSQMGSGN